MRSLLVLLFAVLACATAQDCGNHELTTQHVLITPDGRSRFYLKYKPLGVTTASNYPLVIELHGLSACATNLYSYSGWKRMADEHSFILVTPQGVSRSWNAGRCCGQPREAKLNVDDVSFLRTVARQVIEAEPGIDPTRLYFAGHSTGCMMAQRMAIEASDLVAAIGCHSGILMAPPSSPASDSIATPSGYMPVPVMEIHGGEDRTVNFDYATVLGAPYWPGALRNLGWWQQLNGCPAASPTITSYDSYSIHLHSGCTGSSQAVLIDVPSAGHYPFLSYPPYVDTTQLAWNFVQQFYRHLSPSSPLLSPSLLPPSPSLLPSPFPPSPSLPPPPLVTVFVRLTAAGDVADYDTPNVKNAIAATFASEAGVSPDDVHVRITSASVNIDVSLLVPPQKVSTSVAALELLLATPTDATSFLQKSLQNVASSFTVHVLAVEPIQTVLPQSNDGGVDSETDSSTVVTVTAASGTVVGLLILAAAARWWLWKRKHSTRPSAEVPARRDAELGCIQSVIHSHA
jgi:polyhydroxybutyrate depolymerase